MTGTIQSAAPQVIYNLTSDGALQVQFQNTSGGALVSGQEVTLKTNGTVDKRDAGTEIPIGIVIKGADNNGTVTVRIYSNVIVSAHAIGGTINAGTEVKPNGNINGTSSLPEYVVCADGDYVSAICIKGGTVGTEIKLMILAAPYQLNTGT